MALKKLLLFDIDGTLLSIVERELNVFGSSLRKIFGDFGSMDGYSFAGKTDHQIVLDLLSKAGRTPEEIESELPDLKEHYFEQLDRMLGEETMKVLPGVLELLDDLAGRSDVLLGLQTGNWRRAADIKLERYGLSAHFEVGAFGDGQPDRNGLPPLALERAIDLAGEPIAAADTVIIGDTALDVACARAWGMSSLGVATGSTSLEELKGTGADRAVATLAEVDADGLLDLIRST